LDEPSSGLDPIVRRDILEAVIRTVSDEGRTVLFSSHLLEEIERVSDYVAMLHQGSLVLCGPLDQIKSQHRRITIRFEAQQPEPPKISGALAVTGTGREWTVFCNTREVRLPDIGARVVNEDDASLNEIFVAKIAGKA
jgi:ABC-2 type transport system ATP-binding protein